MKWLQQLSLRWAGDSGVTWRLKQFCYIPHNIHVLFICDMCNRHWRGTISFYVYISRIEISIKEYFLECVKRIIHSLSFHLNLCETQLENVMKLVRGSLYDVFKTCFKFLWNNNSCQIQYETAGEVIDVSTWINVQKDVAHNSQPQSYSTTLCFERKHITKDKKHSNRNYDDYVTLRRQCM